ncbi:MAG: hypothetical protein WBA83_17035 [Burkholderiaceae bacterium]
MNAIGHMAGQIMKASPLKAIADPPPRKKLATPANQRLWPCIIKHGRQIDALHQQGMRLIDIASNLGMNYDGLRGIYSKYRRAKSQGLV